MHIFWNIYAHAHYISHEFSPPWLRRVALLRDSGMVWKERSTRRHHKKRREDMKRNETIKILKERNERSYRRWQKVETVRYIYLYIISLKSIPNTYLRYGMQNPTVWDVIKKGYSYQPQQLASYTVHCIHRHSVQQLSIGRRDKQRSPSHQLTDIGYVRSPAAQLATCTIQTNLAFMKWLMEDLQAFSSEKKMLYS